MDYWDGVMDNGWTMNGLVDGLLGWSDEWTNGLTEGLLGWSDG